MYDNESGQVFREWTVPQRPTPIGELDWSRQRPYPSFRPRGSRGPRSLIDMATNVIANNVGLLSSEHIEPIPIRLVWRIWRFLEARYDYQTPDSDAAANRLAEEFVSRRGRYFPNYCFQRRMTRIWAYIASGSIFAGPKAI